MMLAFNICGCSLGIRRSIHDFLNSSKFELILLRPLLYQYEKVIRVTINYCMLTPSIKNLILQRPI